MSENMTVLERIDRLHRIARMPSIERTGYVDNELAAGLHDLRHDLQEVLGDDMRDCVHCGSPFTFRRADGDIGCKDCPGIMLQREVDTQ